MGEKPLVEAHRQLADAEHSLERELLDEAEDSTDPDHVRRQARAISTRADVHDQVAERMAHRPEE
ncbi:hypothetical protein [Geodermatophilus sp. SYSU D00815]